ncbi:MAG TPA: septum formation initiator family protein [Bacteriovoracaceae bacterium]|nr:septum formation initiator family protein [Bacteriovoracaceae bacterium]
MKSQEEYEEVESPYASKASDKSRLRTKKNVFNRPFAAGTSVAPAVFETVSRRSIGHPDLADMNHHRQSELAQAEIEYLEEETEIEEEEVAEKRPARISGASKKKTKNKKSLLVKTSWSVIGLLVLRLIFMDRGVWDYFTTENTIKEKNKELRSYHRENKELKVEIERIQLDRNYQRLLAKEHLGVIAADEFLILFAGEVPESETTTTNTQI